MTKIENKFIDFINKYMVHIGIFVVALFALGIRYMARKYTGHDVQFLLYEVPGNYTPFAYRSFVAFLLGKTEHVVFILKMLGYIGDAGIFVLTCILLGKKWVMQDALRIFYVLTAIMLSPVLLQSSVTGMRLDSISICFVLIAYLFYQKKNYPIAAISTMLAALVAPMYWLVIVVALAGYVYGLVKKNAPKSVSYHISAAMLLVFFVLYAIVEIKTFCGLSGMGIWYELFYLFRVIGSGVATFLLIASLKKAKLRKVALIMQVVMLVVIGYWQTYHTAIWTMIENSLNAL